MARRRWNPSRHPRWPNGRFRPTYVRGSFEKNTKVGRGGKYIGIKTGAEFRFKNGGQVLVKGIAGYAPPKKAAK
ncbi:MULTISPECIES: hypothetical protein [unclassified Pseudonocardia]|uniref:hypothetical protein n=1 Tax=unclassified Pseudonocardia TaxID=2619320 RepID=UPI0001FFDF7C|nr:hypothetical protein [Pseudonocardia sp. Ae707_Ps1]OLM17585.1 hypothetical protein Ae707Ps1_1844c [Pseudonocardia sp. Ae707_Ps1]